MLVLLCFYRPWSTYCNRLHELRCAPAKKKVYIWYPGMWSILLSVIPSFEEQTVDMASIMQLSLDFSFSLHFDYQQQNPMVPRL